MCTSGKGESSHEKLDWTQTSFSKYLTSKHPHLVAFGSEPLFQLLWRCLYCYAYHPFPRSRAAVENDQRIDFPAFQRATSLLALQGTDLLATQDEGAYYWRYDKDHFQRRDFVRVFGNIGTPLEGGNGRSLPDQGNGGQESVADLEDIMDVLAMAQPHSINVAPEPEQLEHVAKRILAGNAALTPYVGTCKDLATLISILVRLRLGGRDRASRSYYGMIDKEDTASDNLARALVDALGEPQKGDHLSPNQIERAMEIFPNLRVRFYQLWASIFQPPIAAESLVPPLISGDPPHSILQAVALFIPHAGTLDSKTPYERRITFTPVEEPGHTSSDLTLPRLPKALEHIPNSQPDPHLLLISSPTSPTILGAYLPSYNSLQTNAYDHSTTLAEQRPLLFQLQPRFRLFRWVGHGTATALTFRQLISIDDETISVEAIVAGERGYGKKYCIAPGPGLEVDPEKGAVTLKLKDTGEGDVEMVRGVEKWDIVGRHMDERDGRLGEQEIVVEDARMHVYRVVM